MSINQLFPDFEPRVFEVNGIQIAGHIGGSGSPLLLLHGHPQTHAIWHKLAPALMKSHTLVMTDLRGYGDSSKPQGDVDHSNYSKRVMAQDQVEVMNQLGFDRFDVLAHDRGARVAHRLAMDHADAVNKLIMLDIAPTLSMYEKTTEAFAKAYWHWFFLIQPSPLPERLIEADPAGYLRDVMGRRFAGLKPFDPLALAEYMRCVALPGAAHGMCEDYRAAAGIDLIHDREDIAAGKKLEMPTMVLWGADGVVNKCFKPLEEWQAICRNVIGETLPCGHYLPEEAPDMLLEKVATFLHQDS
ncbi:alpha/beta fold hydrolase [Polynucleobacter sp. AP-Ainpum-60-G11]|uniref:alpha/beta fold hydrolase n=1 Tax=Polynucleobacter sp. AP-Ainpum-60-G11 TaxID=2576926 RepID=UPI001BFE2E9C|nr:alpha/beta hydrolase [Polynucleobacter sp. AP-Ainpum-60-G11]QWE26148.1 alpha/beta hydrolase [Polynucleobacter sp. AP-Ainpum-60-G11]